MFGYSREQNRYALTGHCPRCRKFVMKPRFSKPDDQPVKLMIIPLMDRGTIATCPKCSASWPVFDNDSNAPAVREPVDVPAVRIVEEGRTDEQLGSEVRVIDNSASDVPSLRRMKATKRWRRACEIQMERTETATNGFELDPGMLASMKSEMQSAIRSNYTIRTEEEDLFEEEIEISIPGRAAVEVRLHWKRIWQHGVAIAMYSSGYAIRTPFRVVAGITFDQEIVDVRR